MFLQREMTAKEFLSYAGQHPEKRFDFMDGEMVEVPPKAVHAGIQATFTVEFGIYLKQHPIGKVYTEVLLVLNGVKMMPDVCIHQPTSDDCLTTPPLVTVEIRSDSQSKRAQQRKAINYIENGVKMSILVFPGENIEVYFAGRDVKVLTYGDTLNGEDILPDFSILVDELL